VVVEIDDEFGSLPEEDRSRLVEAWLDGLSHRDVLDVDITGADMVAGSRADMGW
jgi:hypothetical protein